ncbi:MAG: sulfide/dihydroorotate dehydrogenase-like FAD/NAD-binding protein [Verrucomicrobia bacterium]|nr:MAG: sulfide/dihydroorotate dehydrogenase-like FAD/NAD-binding protein [Verrucomicrobiota bacterium]
MHLVTGKVQLSPNVTRLDLEASRIAEIRQPGQFVIVRRGNGAERIPLTLADADSVRGTIALVIQAVGKSTCDLVALEVGDSILDISGPLGHPTEMIAAGRAVCVGGGVGTAVVHPIAQGLAQRGVEVISIIGGRSRQWVIFEEELSRLGQVIVCSDDGSYGRQGFVTDATRELLEAGRVDIVYAVGPVPMMRAVANLTKPFGVRTIVSLNPVMVDGTGMCGGCRVDIGGETKFACVDGPEFDGHLVDFDLLAERLGTYREFEQRASAGCEAGSCRVGLTRPDPPSPAPP